MERTQQRRVIATASRASRLLFSGRSLLSTIAPCGADAAVVSTPRRSRLIVRGLCVVLLDLSSLLALMPW